MNDPFEDYPMSTFSFEDDDRNFEIRLSEGDDPPTDPPPDPPADPAGTDTGGTIIIKPGEFEENPKKQ